jgi:hypothetical protein
MRHNPFYNPYAKPGTDPHGKSCFYIYNDDGTPAMSASGPRFCYSSEKAEQLIEKVTRAGFRVSPSATSPGPRPASADERSYAAPSVKERNLAILNSKMAALTPILNHHLVKSAESHWGRMRERVEPSTVHGIREVTPRHKYAVIHSKPIRIRRDANSAPELHYPAEFVVNLENLELSRADGNGQPRPEWNFGHVDEVISRGRTLKDRQNPKRWV